MPRHFDDLIERYCRYAELTQFEFRLMKSVANVPLADMSTGELFHRLSVTPDEREDVVIAQSQLLDRGLIQVVTEETLEQLRDQLAAEDSAPIFSYLPWLGNVDFTWQGAILWTGIAHAIYGHSSYWLSDDLGWNEDGYHCREVVGVEEIDVLRRLAPDELRKFIDSDKTVHEVRGPYPIGWWRSPWWRLFRSGYHARILYR